MDINVMTRHDNRRGLSGILLKLVLALLVLLVLALLAARAFFPALAFHPRAEVLSTPRDINLPFEEVTFQSGPWRLSGWYVPARESRAHLLFCHGNGGNISWRLDSLRIFNQLGLSVLIFDYRGYGKSEGKPTPRGTEEDALAAWEWLAREKGAVPERTVFFGRSLGGAVALGLTRSVKPKALVLESTFASPFGVARIEPLIPLLRSVIGDVWNSEAVARTLDIPTLCFHSPDDGIVPFQEGVKLYRALAGPKTFVVLQGGHNDCFLVSFPNYQKAFDEFLTRHFGPAK